MALVLRFFSSSTRRALRSPSRGGGAEAIKAQSQSGPLTNGDRMRFKAESNLNPVQEVEKVMRYIQVHCYDARALRDVAEVLRGMELVSMHRFRTPLRDLAALLLPYCSEAHSDMNTLMIDQAIRALSMCGRGMVYFEEFFDFVVKRRDMLDSSQLSVVLYECGRHGLRSKHFLKRLLVPVPPMVRDMNLNDACLALKGVCKFAGEYREFVNECLKRIVYQELNSEQSLTVLRALRQTEQKDEFVKLVSTMNWDNFSTVEKLNGIYLLKRARTLKMDRKAEGVISTVAKKQVASLRRAKLDGAIVTDVSDCLDSMASWKIRDDLLLQRMMDLLTSRVAEIKYSPICGLWQAITDSTGHLHFFHPAWMRVVDEMGSSAFNLKKFASFQLVFFISSLGRLNFYSPTIFEAVSSVVSEDMSSIRDMDMIATLLFPFERIGTADFKTLAISALNQAKIILSFTKGDKLRDRDFLRSCIVITYCATSMGVELSNEGLRTLVDFLSSKTIEMQHVSLTADDRDRFERLSWFGVLDVDPRTAPEDSTIPFVHHMQEDGAVVVKICSKEDMMMMWANPDDHKSHELVPIARSGSQRLITDFLTRRGFTRIEFR
jgi:hypothetical protein